MMPIHAYYDNAQGKILVGDPFRPGPVVQSTFETNKFAGQMGISFMGRLQGAGFPFTLFTTQYLMNPEIAAPVSKVVYKGKVTKTLSVNYRDSP